MLSIVTFNQSIIINGGNKMLLKKLKSELKMYKLIVKIGKGELVTSYDSRQKAIEDAKKIKAYGYKCKVI